MKIVAFAGPSIPEPDRERFPDVVWKPPAEAGDLLRLDIDPSTAVCLIDGYFDHRPAVRHKEILLLLAEGVRIFGASSIGALRAAEMDIFGMRGVGAIYRAYARGILRGDDEVALIHAPADSGWRPLSLPLVDVRATLCRARRENILTRSEARTLLAGAGGIHYVERTWAAIFETSGTDGQAAIRAWLATGQVEQKRLDALGCLRLATEDSCAPRKRPVFVRTPFLDALAKQCEVEIDVRCSALPAPSASARMHDKQCDWH